MFNVFQIVVITLFTALMTWHKYNLQILYYAQVVGIGAFCGLVMGDLNTGLLVGGTMCLMSLGLAGYGGSSVPNYQLGCIAGTVFAIGMGQAGDEALSTALAVGVPVAALGVQLDVLGKMSGSFFIHRAMACSDNCDWKGMATWTWASQIAMLGLNALPIAILMTAGSGAVEMLVNNFPAWLSTGLNVAAGMLPAMGFAILLHYLPIKKYGYFLILGYVLASYAGLSVLAIALIGAVICVYVFQDLEKDSAMPAVAVAGGDMEDE
ncbi:PTS mannose/fructose/sorbose/N-acetylgalactosamine transporter subunit IIC [Thermophilibacter provencensis]|uniref:PTS sugar transporter subunit IIC n=1 Tax=Thermophilibacter provencensis TaxID=1852386 RepID=A0ABT7V609_9ACTN|nr:PTS sugar transporter subunit IIC [Thermophilibacter provencensis]MDM8271431.1 PTS sugar transporter subunit IIC [Thermophilibacter provencensis]